MEFLRNKERLYIATFFTRSSVLNSVCLSAAFTKQKTFHTNPNIPCTKPSSSIHFVKVFHGLALVFKVAHCDIVAPNMNFPTGVWFIRDEAVSFFPVHQSTWKFSSFTSPPLLTVYDFDLILYLYIHERSSSPACCTYVTEVNLLHTVYDGGLLITRWHNEKLWFVVALVEGRRTGLNYCQQQIASFPCVAL